MWWMLFAAAGMGATWFEIEGAPGVLVGVYRVTRDVLAVVGGLVAEVLAAVFHVASFIFPGTGL